MSMRKTLLLAALVSSIAIPATAQNFNARPTYGTLTLRGGFLPDPHVTRVQAGGNLSAERLGRACRGFIAARPDVRLNFRPGSLPLIISAASRADTVLVVNGPDGRWYCDDDGGVNGFNPALRFNNPQGGRYEIWVGTYRGGQLEPARLHISEVRSQ